MVLVKLAYMEGWTYGRTDVHDVMAIKPNFLTMVLRKRAPSARAELRYEATDVGLGAPL